MTALITGVGGQDGILMARRLVAEGARVVGTVPPGWDSPLRVYLDGVEIVEVDVRDEPTMDRLIADVQPDEAFHLAAISSVGDAVRDPDLTRQVNDEAVAATLRSLERHVPKSRSFLASSAEVFGPEGREPRTEDTPLDPRNPYAESKAQVHSHAAAARTRGQFVSVGILFNHESPIRGEQFVTRKVARAAAAIASGLGAPLIMGNLESQRDWAAASDVVEAMIRMVRADDPGTAVVATGTLRTVRELIEAAFGAAGVDDVEPWIDQDEALVRRSDTPGRVADVTHAREWLGWQPTVAFEDLIASMVAADIQRLRTGVEEDQSYLP